MTNTKKILMVASFSPPVTGQSVASEAVFDCLHDKSIVSIVNLSKPSFKAGFNSLSRLFQVMMITVKVVRQARNVDLVYFTVSQSFFGLLKDLIILMLCYKNLSKFVIHSHGFGLRYSVLDKHNLLSYIFKFSMRRVKKFIVLGPTHKYIMRHFVPEEKIEIVYNFSDPNLFLEPLLVERKFDFSTPKPLEFIFVSNLLPGKGYLELVNAYRSICNVAPMDIKLTIAGGFQSDTDRKDFLSLISNEPSIEYIGIADFETKKKIFSNAHVFFLPTYYAFEGQPISILEAYASGCVVVSTRHAGIPDVFGEKNGFVVEAGSVSSIVRVFNDIFDNRDRLVEIAKANQSVFFERHSKRSFINRIISIIQS